ncbi:MAG TPA: serine hydrolase domain-containing protein [Dehalococcoidia bacterium]
MDLLPGAYIETLRHGALGAAGVQAWARTMLDEGHTPNLQAAIYRDGKLAISIAAGRTPDGALADRRSLYCILSCTKLYTTLCMLALHDRGYFDFDEPVANHWPEFGTLGKERITFRHVLSHRAGIRLGPAGTTWPAWGDREAVGRLMTRLELEWEPGTKVAYHNRTFGFVLDYVVWCWLGKGIDGVLGDDVLRPLGISDFYMGLPRSEYDTRLVKTVAIRDQQGQAMRRDPANDMQGQDPEFRPRIGGEPNMFNSFELLSLPLAWGTACANAEAAAAIANFYAFEGLYDTVRLFSKETWARAIEEQPPVPSADGGPPANFALGPRLGWFPNLEKAGRNLGHGGGQTAVVWVDLDKRISAACFLGGVAPRDMDRQRFEFASAVYDDLGY